MVRCDQSTMIRGFQKRPNLWRLMTTSDYSWHKSGFSTKCGGMGWFSQPESRWVWHERAAGVMCSQGEN